LLLPSLLCALCAAGCASSGSPRADAALARIRPARELHRNVYLERVDGRPLGLLRESAALEPGRHVVVATVVWLDPERRVAATHALEFEAQAGRVYTVHGDWGAWGPRLWISDGRSAEPVAEAEVQRGRPQGD
jgi:hypothetical protein